MRIFILLLLAAFATSTLIPIQGGFADQIDGMTIEELFETVSKVQDEELQLELTQQIKNIAYGLKLEIPNNN